MRTLQVILGTCAVVALMGLNVATADIRNMSLEGDGPLKFTPDLGDGTIMPEISFDMMGGVGGDEAQQTCMMTPGGPALNVLLDLPPIAPVSQAGYSSPQTTLAPVNSLNMPPSSYSPGGGRGGPFDPTYPPGPPLEPPPIVLIPAPATLLIVGLGITSVAAMRRRRETKKAA